MSKGHTEEEARRICGALQRDLEQESKDSGEEKDEGRY
jgi:hypothetical protein